MISMYIFYNLVYALLSFPIGVLADKFGLARTLVSGLIVFALVYFFMGYAVLTWQYILLFGLYAFYAASTEGISKALISNIAGKDKIATAIGFYTGFASIFSLIASSVAGLIWYLLGMKIMFIVSGAGVFIVAVYLAGVQLYISRIKQE